MVREPVSVQLIDRLRLEGFVPETADLELGRVYAGRAQRSQGAWSWCCRWGYDGNLAKTVGSQFTMAMCVRADRLEACRDSVSDVSLFPLNDEDIRSR